MDQIMDQIDIFTMTDQVQYLGKPTIELRELFQIFAPELSHLLFFSEFYEVHQFEIIWEVWTETRKLKLIHCVYVARLCFTTP